MTGTMIQCILLLIAHASVGIYSSTLKFRKKTTYIIWGTWIVFQTAILIYTEFVLTDRMMQFFAGFVLSLVGQYVIYFLTTKGILISACAGIAQVCMQPKKRGRGRALYLEPNYQKSELIPISQITKLVFGEFIMTKRVVNIEHG